MTLIYRERSLLRCEAYAEKRIAGIPYILTGLLLIAAWLRFAALPDLPPGINHDEVAEVLIAQGILEGHHAIFFQDAYGQEPLFLYLVAGALVLFGQNVLALRFVSASIGLLTVAASARWARRLFGPRVALVTAAGVAVMFWPVFWSRLGLRGMLLPLCLTLGAEALWAVLRGRHKLGYALAGGVWFGLSAYTYLAARGIPILLAAWLAVLWLCDRERLRRRWRLVALTYMIAALIALPLVIYLAGNKEAQTRVYEVDAPLRALQQGDVGPVLENVGRVLGMFTVRGDRTERNNLPGRPVFVEPVWAALFYAGLALALWRLRDVRYAMLVIWLGVMVIPSVVTTEAPNFVRTLGALPAVMALPGLGAWALVQNLHKIDGRTGARAPVAWVWLGWLVLSLALAANLLLTLRAYWVRWPAIPEVAFVWQKDLRAVAAWLDRHPEVGDTVVSGLSNSTMDATTLDLMLRRDDVRVRWCDTGSPLSSAGALVFPKGGGALLLPAIVPLDVRLASYVTAATGAPLQGVSPEGGGDLRIGYVEGQEDETDSPVAVWEPVSLLDVAVSGSSARAGQTLELVSTWVAAGETPTPALKIFVHLVDADGVLVAQHDGLDCPAIYWQPGDRLVQLHRLPLPEDLAPGLYALRMGLYDEQTLAPLALEDGRRYEEIRVIDVSAP